MKLKTRQSEYMHWAKTRSTAKFNLATSGLANLSLNDLEFSVNELEITGLDGYGYEPLIQELSQRYRVDQKSIVTAAGTSFANHLAMAALIDPGDEVLIERPTYEDMMGDQIEAAIAKSGPGTLEKLIHSGDTWVVE